MTVELFNNPPTKFADRQIFRRGDREQLFGLNGRSDGSNRVRLAVYLPKGALLGSASPQLFAGEEQSHQLQCLESN